MFELVIIMQFLTKDWSNLHDKQAQIIRHTKLFLSQREEAPSYSYKISKKVPLA